MSSTPADAGRAFRPRLWPTLATAGRAGRSAGVGHLAAAAHGLEARSHRPRRGAAGRTGASSAGGRPVRPGLSARLGLGTYLHDLAFAFGFSAEGGRPGGRLITPFRLTDGRTILVDRGWIPEDLLPPNLPAGLQPAGTVGLEGIARWRGDAKRAWMAPDDTPASRRWYNWDIPAMAAALGLTIEPLEIVLERSEGSAGSAQGGDGLDRFPQ